jgi:hypothetical protein
LENPKEERSVVAGRDVYSHVLHTANALFAPSQVVELRAIFKNGRVDSGYFNDFSLLAEAAVKLDERSDVSGVYWTLNPVKPDCLHRAKNRLREWASKSKGGTTTSDTEILERRLILLDFDGAARPAGISAAKEELDAAREKARRVAKFLAERKWGKSLAAMSGNGYHLLYRTTLPNDSKNAELLKKCLSSLALLFDDEVIKLDTTVYNASRICKVYGTVAKKGDDTQERPHRRSMLLKSVDESVPITTERIEAIAALLPEEPQRKPGRPHKNSASPIDVPLWVREHLGHISITEEKDFKGGKLYVLSECPFNPQHKAPDSAIGQYSSGAVFFKCFHNSCKEHDWQALRERFDPKTEYAHERKREQEARSQTETLAKTTGLPTIDLSSGQLRDVVEEVIEAINAVNIAGKTDPLLYVRGDRLARIVSDSDKRFKPALVPVEAMPEIMSRAANFVRGNESGYIDVFPPETLARAIVHRGHWPFPILRGVVEIPVLRKDGSILDNPGYDPASELYYHPTGSIPKIPDIPTRRDAETAAGFLLDVLSDFPFQDEASRDNAVGLLLTVVVKEIVGLAPMALIDAPTKGTGKTRLAQIISIVSSGHELPLSPEVRDEEEWRKQITSLLIADRPIVIIDNVDRMLCSSQLAAVLTTSEWSDRLLGRSEVLHLHSRAIWIATGNNIRLGGDIARRAYWIRLNSNLSKPWMRDSRSFKRELPVWAISHRSEMVAALLTIARAWFLDGKPKWTGQPLGSYETWSRTVGGILEYCGVKGFLSNLEDLYEQTDDEPAQWSAFFEAVLDVFGENNAFSTKALMEQISGEFEGFSKDFSKGRLNGKKYPFLSEPLPERGSGEIEKFSRGQGEKNCSFSPETLEERVSGESGSFYGQQRNLGENSVNNSLKSALPDSLGDPGDKGFSRRLGLAIRKRKDQIFVMEEGFIQLQEDFPDKHRQKPQWKLVRMKDALSAPVAPSCSNLYIAEKINIENRQGNDDGIIFPLIEGAAEQGAEGALDAKGKEFVFEDDPEERAAIQGESQKDGGERDGATQAE